MNRMQQKYQQEVRPKLQSEFGSTNVFAPAQIKKVTVNMGIARPVDPKEREKVVENVVKQIAVIAGQQPQITRARKAVADFKLRQGDPLGVMVTLRGEKMWEFLDKLVSITLPRVKDFRGIPKKAFDGAGNYSLGLEEQIVFPEIEYDQIESVRGLQINIMTSTKSNQEALRLLELLGFPFEKPEEEKQ
jgi:large subunit ribosomal protein L5